MHFVSHPTLQMIITQPEPTIQLLVFAIPEAFVT